MSGLQGSLGVEEQRPYDYGMLFVKFGDGDSTCKLVPIESRDSSTPDAEEVPKKTLDREKEIPDDTYATIIATLREERQEQVNAAASDSMVNDTDRDDEEPAPHLPPRLYLDYGDIPEPAISTEDTTWASSEPQYGVPHDLIDSSSGDYASVSDSRNSGQKDEDRSPSYESVQTRGSRLLASMKQLSTCGYYWGPISEHAAKEKLIDQPDGTFLLYDSSHVHHLYAVSVVLNGTAEHFLIDSYDTQSGYKFSHPSDHDELARTAQPVAETLSWRRLRPSVIELIDWAMVMTSKTKHRRGMHPYLVKPLMQPYEVPMLQHLIRSYMCDVLHLSRQQVRELPIPRITQDYVLEYGYFTS
ncbi:suppressor of cytokine signaling 2-like [Sycon ciliatum]|uniref:suppressor of cytokine signaling 2-like n=1 Tax=Sycon ciliatum TaxID=27933 RepID=UPI0031F6AE58